MNDQNQDQYVDFNDQEYEVGGFDDQAYDTGGYQQGAYDDGAMGDDEVDGEDFPEPAQAAEEKKGLSKAKLAVGGVLALALVAGAGYFMMAGGEEGGGGMPDIMAMFSGESSGEGEVPPDAGSGEGAPGGEAPPPPKRPVKKPPPKPVAAKPPAKPAAAKPAKPANDGWKEPVRVASKPKPVEKPKPVAAKPKPVAAAAKPAAPSAPTAHTAITFAHGSYWVAASDMERLWAFSSGLKSNTGRITVEAHPGTEADAAELTRKRANRVAELLKRNNVGNRFDVNIKIGGAEPNGRRVDVYYSKQL